MQFVQKNKTIVICIVISITLIAMLLVYISSEKHTLTYFDRSSDYYQKTTFRGLGLSDQANWYGKIFTGAVVNHFRERIEYKITGPGEAVFVKHDIKNNIVMKGKARWFLTDSPPRLCFIE